MSDDRGLWVSESYELLKILSRSVGLYPQPSDLSLSAARRFAESIILIRDNEAAKARMLEDREGALALLALAEEEPIEKAHETLESDYPSGDIILVYYPVCSWLLAAIDRRTP